MNVIGRCTLGMLISRNLQCIDNPKRGLELAWDYQYCLK